MVIPRCYSTQSMGICTTSVDEFVRQFTYYLWLWQAINMLQVCVVHCSMRHADAPDTQSASE